MSIYHQTGSGPVEVNSVIVHRGNETVTPNYIIRNGKLVFADKQIYLSGPVNYKVVGSPSIVDGVASDFTSSNYVGIESQIDFKSANTWEMFIAVKFDSLTPGRSLFDFRDYGGHGITSEIQNNNNISFQIDGGIGWQESAANTLQTTSEMYMKYAFTGTSYTLNTSLDKTTWQEIINIQTSVKMENSQIIQAFGASPIYGNPLNGSIDLKETYIKLDNNLYFYGKNYASSNIAPVPSGYTYGTTTTSAIGWVDMRTQQFTAAPSGATIGKDE